MDLPLLPEEMRQALRASEEDPPGPVHRMRVPASTTVTAMVLTPGRAPGIPAYTVKIHAKNPIRAWRSPSVPRPWSLKDRYAGHRGQRLTGSEVDADYTGGQFTGEVGDLVGVVAGAGLHVHADENV